MSDVGHWAARAIAAWALALTLAAPALAGPFEDGVAAYGRGDYATAVRSWRPLADQGDVAAQYNLGFLYDKGQGVPQDHAEAVRWYRKAADQGDAAAQYNLGLKYAKGQGVPRDDSEAAQWFRKAADQGVAKAQYNLGVMYGDGQGVPRDDSEAVRWYRKAADQGDAKAQNNLGVMYGNGQGVPQDYVQAHIWFNLAAAQGDKDAENKRNIVANRMSPAQIAEAQRLARDWRPASAPAAGSIDAFLADVETPSGAMVSEAQRLLGRLGYSPGAADGKIGPRTRVAVTEYQRRNGLAVDGRIDKALVARLRRDAERVAPPSRTMTFEEFRGATPPVPKVAGTGTGFFVDRDGHLLTNAHVVKGCAAVRVRRVDGGAVAAEVVSTSDGDDLALLKAAERAGAVAAFRTGTPVRQGEAVWVYGFPLAPLLASSGNLTTGTVSALAGPRDDARLLQISAPVQPGNSGGPVLDGNGNVVGVVVGKLDALLVARAVKDIPQNVNFAIKASVATNFLEARATPYKTGSALAAVFGGDVADKARRITVRVECLR